MRSPRSSRSLDHFLDPLALVAVLEVGEDFGVEVGDPDRVRVLAACRACLPLHGVAADALYGAPIRHPVRDVHRASAASAHGPQEHSRRASFGPPADGPGAALQGLVGLQPKGVGGEGRNCHVGLALVLDQAPVDLRAEHLVDGGLGPVGEALAGRDAVEGAADLNAGLALGCEVEHQGDSLGLALEGLQGLAASALGVAGHALAGRLVPGPSAWKPTSR